MAADSSSAHTIRLACRSGTFKSPTTGVALGHIQVNLLVLPSEAAADFQGLCLRNPVPCPLLGCSLAGDPHTLDTDGLISRTHEFDVRTDLPLYNIYRNGRLVESKSDILQECTEDHVAFLVGCSFSFEAALAREGLAPRHWALACNVPMYKTTRPLNPSGVFSNSQYVVSMRPYKADDIEKVREVTRTYTGMHGEPIAWGWDAVRQLGIEDIDKPEFGDAVEIRREEGEVPVFWGCGVTPQAAVMEAGSKIRGMVMAHAPGHMLVLDMNEEDVFKLSNIACSSWIEQYISCSSWNMLHVLFCRDV